MSFFELAWTNPIILSSLLAGLAASIVSGVIGSYVVVKRIVFVSGSIAHAVLGGLGCAVWLQRSKGIEWISPVHGALVAALLTAIAIAWIRLYYRQREDTVIAALWSIGMATGIVFIQQTPGSGTELNNFLVGNILWVSHSDLAWLWALDMFILALVFALHKRFLAICFDEDQAQLQGVPVKGLYFLLLILIAISVVLLVEVVGIVLVITMLTIPPTIANLFLNRLSRIMIAAVAIAAVLNTSGTIIAFHLDWPPGATIALLAGASYLSCLAIKEFFFRFPLPKL